MAPSTHLAVVQVAHGWPPERLGGVELYARALHRALLEQGVDSSVFHAGASASRTDKRRQVVGPSPDARHFLDTVTRPEVEAHFAEWLALRAPAIVHFHHLTHLSLGLPRLARRMGALPLMTLHDYWLPCVRGQLVDRRLNRCPGPEPARCADCVAGQLALEPGIAAAGRLLAPLPPGLRAALREFWGRSRRGGLQPVIAERQRRVAAAVSQVARFHSPSADLARRIGRLCVPADRIDVMDLPLVHPVRSAPPVSPGVVRFLFLGSLIPTKGPHLLLEAFARLPAGAARLHLVGPSPANDLDPGYAERLRARARALPGVTVEGPFQPGQVQARLDASDVLVLPSLWEENSPLVVREARAAGLRVLASRRGGVSEIAPEARWFEPEQAGSLLKALAREVRQGRGRLPAAPIEGPEEHAASLCVWYERCLQREDTGLRS